MVRDNIVKVCLEGEKTRSSNYKFEVNPFSLVLRSI